MLSEAKPSPKPKPVNLMFGCVGLELLQLWVISFLGFKLKSKGKTPLPTGSQNSRQNLGYGKDPLASEILTPQYVKVYFNNLHRTLKSFEP